MTSAVSILNIPADILNISPTSSTSRGSAVALPRTTLCGRGLEDVEDVELKKFLRGTYLLSVVTRGSLPLRPVRATQVPTSTRTYLGLNILNIPKTWHATSHSVQMARALDDLAARQAATLARLRRQTPAIRKDHR
jgi:hypothetical protein